MQATSFVPTTRCRKLEETGNEEGFDVLLSDRDIYNTIECGDIEVTPFDSNMVQPASLDVRLSSDFLVFRNHLSSVIDPSTDNIGLTESFRVPEGEPLVLHPGEFVLAATLEIVGLEDNIAARFEGKSSLGRLGLITHATAGFIDPGFRGQITLELANMATLPIKLWPGMKIGQLCFMPLTTPADRPYGAGATGSRYHRQLGPTASRSHIGFNSNSHPGTIR